MARYVVYQIPSGLVVNIVEWDGNTVTWQPPPLHRTVQKDTAGNIGDKYDPRADIFIPPPPAPPPPPGTRFITSADSPYQVLQTDQAVFADATGGAVEIVMPVFPTDNQGLHIKKVSTDTNPVTIHGNGATMDGTSIIVADSSNKPSLQFVYQAAVNDWRIV